MDFDKELINILYSIDWFSNCGKPIILENVENLSALSKLKKAIQSTQYENVVLEYQGSFTETLFISYREQYNKWWNILVGQFKSLYLPELSKVWECRLTPLKLNAKYVIADLSFNILGIAVIGAYKEQISMPDFFKTMLAVYQSGHLVCGWSGDKETGKFIAY